MKYIYLALFGLILCQCSELKVETNTKNEVLAIQHGPAQLKDSIDLNNNVEENTTNRERPDQNEEEGNINNITEGNESINIEPHIDPFDPDFISGKWEAEDYNEVSFETWFNVEDGIVSGQYCAVNADASRIDCGTQDEVDICYVKSLHLVGTKKLELEIVSCYSHKKGKASIEAYGDGELLWELIESPGIYGIDHFAHESAILRKVHFDPFE